MEAGPGRFASPRVERERVWNPGIAAVGVVFDDYEPTSGSKHVPDGTERPVAVSQEVQRVGRQHAIEGSVRDRCRVVEHPRLELRFRKAALQCSGGNAEGSLVTVAGEDRSR